MSRRYDAIVAGLGAVGSATLLHLAKLGRRALGLDPFSPPHAHGSSHGDTRITRLAIGEGEHYTPLAMRSHALWRDLERETGARLLAQNGGLIISSDGTRAHLHVANFFANTVAAAKRFGIAHEILDAPTIRRRFPPFNVRDDEVGYFEPAAGFLRPEACVAANLSAARRHGAQIRCEEAIARFDASADRVVAVTAHARYEADALIIAVGPWLASLVDARLARHFGVYRQVLLWFDIDGAFDAFAQERFPVFIWEPPHGSRGVYGFPAIDGPRGGVKVATEAFDATTTPDRCERGVTATEIEAIHAECVAPYLRRVSRRCVRATTCLYTVAPDFGFVVDAHPDSDRVLIASACSGHGFKHSPAIGEALARWIVERAKPAELAPFALARLDAAVTDRTPGVR